MSARYHLTPELSRRAVEFQAPRNPTQQILKAAGLDVELRNDGKHWLITGRGLRLSY